MTQVQVKSKRNRRWKQSNQTIRDGFTNHTDFNLNVNPSLIVSNCFPCDWEKICPQKKK